MLTSVTTLPDKWHNDNNTIRTTTDYEQIIVNYEMHAMDILG